MAIRPWLEGLQRQFLERRKRGIRGRVAAPALLGEVESVEERTLLTATTLFLAGELQILTDANENVTVRQDPANANRVQVQINGSAFAALPTIAPAQVTSLVINTGDSENVVDVSPVVATAFTNLTSIRIDTGNGNDTIIGSDDFAESIDAGDGNDSITGRGGADSINAGDGADTVSGGVGNDVIQAGDGNDNVSGDDGDDSITGGDGADSLSGGLGNDTADGGDASDTISGDAGDDSLLGDLGGDSILGGIGNDTVFAGGGNDSILGGDGNDLLNGNSGADVITGEVGDDSLYGSFGNDSVSGSVGNDLIDGGQDDDSLVGNQGNDAIYGGAGADLVLGDGQDSASTETGNDSLFGNAGQDTLIGGQGADTLDGGTGNDLVRSAFEFAAESVTPPTPPAPPPPPPPTPTVGGSAFPDATDSGLGVVTNSTLTTLINGAGDGSLNASTDSTGRLTTTIYDPIGAVAAADTTFRNDVYMRVGLNGGAGNRQALSSIATNASNLRVNGTTEANSTFTIGNLTFALTQTTRSTFDANGVLTGSLLTQTYRMTNNGAANEQFELVRYYDGDLQFDGTLIDGGGRLVTSQGDELLFETDRGGGGATATTFVGITGKGGTIPTTGRYRIDSFGTMSSGVPNGLPMTDTIVGDATGDGFIDTGNEYDVTLNIRNIYDILPGASAIYTTHTIFGNGAPNAVAVNVVPTATNDTASGTSINGSPIFIDVVSNDSDSDGSIVYSTINIVTQPANGTAVSLGNGLIQYTPNVGFSGVDTFQYTIADNSNGVSTPATVTVNVTAVTVDTADDQLNGGDGLDTVIGADGDDLITGDLGDDVLQGLGGNDSIYGGAGNDTIDGGTGQDVILGQGGNDSVFGGDDDDILVWKGAGQGNDTVDGGNGQDGVQVLLGSTGNVVTIGATAGGALTVTESGQTLTVAEAGASVSVNGGGGDDSITLGNLNAVSLGLLVVNGDFGNDIISAQSGSYASLYVSLLGGAGNDILVGSPNGEFMDGGDDNDIIDGRAGNDTIDGGNGADNITGGAGNDQASGGDGVDVVNGGAGDDLLNGGFGNDSLDGGDGNDTLDGGFVDDWLLGGLGNDSMFGNLGLDTLIAGAGNDTLNGGRNDDILVGNAGNDRLIGDHGNDLINGGDGNDTIRGDDGDDTIYGGNGDDLISAGDGNDFVSGDAGRDLIIGGDGNDTLLGGSEQDTLLGQQGDDQLNGNGGTDLGAKGGGNDIAINIEVLDETFVLSAAVLTALNGS